MTNKLLDVAYNQGFTFGWAIGLVCGCAITVAIFFLVGI